MWCVSHAYEFMYLNIICYILIASIVTIYCIYVTTNASIYYYTHIEIGWVVSKHSIIHWDQLKEMILY